MARQQPTIEGLLSNLTTSVVAARAENVQQHLLDQLITMHESSRSHEQPEAASANEDTNTDGWSAAGWISSCGIGGAVADTLGFDASTDIPALRRLGALSEASLVEMLRSGGLAEKVAALLHQSLSKIVSGEAVTGEELHSKFVAEASDEAFTLKYGDVSTFFGGLEGKIGAPDAKIEEAMRREHCESADSKEIFLARNYGVETTPQTEYWFVAEPEKHPDVVWPQETRAGMPSDEKRKPLPIKADDGDSLTKRLAGMNDKLEALGETLLLMAEALGGRLYTGPLFVKYNDILRKFGPALAGCLGNRYVTTIHVINSCIVKGSKLTVVGKVYRGVSGGLLPNSFWEANNQGVRGGVEMAFLSTTKDRNVALEYASNGHSSSHVFEMQMGMVDRGADLSWLSQYPHEQEICFPPLTGLEVQGTRVDGATLVVEVRASVNLNALTIEEVVAKRRKLLLDMAASMNLEVRDAVRRQPGYEGEDGHVSLLADWADLQVGNHLALSHPAEYFNDDDHFCSAVRDALDLKQQLVNLASSGPPQAASPKEITLKDLPWFEGMWITKPPKSLDGCSATAYLDLFKKGKKDEAFNDRASKTDKTDNFQRLSPECVVKIANSSNVVVNHQTLEGTEIDTEGFRIPTFHSIPQWKASGCESLLFQSDVGVPYKAHNKVCVMTCKMGTRTFRESQVHDQKLRPDLAKKLQKLFKDLSKDESAREILPQLQKRSSGLTEPTEEELRDGILKLDYMKARDTLSTSGQFGWRIESVHRHDAGKEEEGGEGPYSASGLKKIITIDQLEEALVWFTKGRPDIAAGFHQRLSHLREVLERSDWFKSHQLVTTMLLFLYDGEPGSTAPPGVFIHRLNYADALPEGKTITHRLKWESDPPNHEDGYLIGLDSLCETMGKAAESQE